MTYCHLHNRNASKQSVFDLLCWLLSIVVLISSIMCLAIAAMSVFLPSADGVMLWFVLASLSSGCLAYTSIQRLKRKMFMNDCNNQ